MRSSTAVLLLLLCAVLLTTCSEERKRALNNPTDPESGNYVGHEVRDPHDPVNGPTVQIIDAPTRIKIGVPYTFLATANDPNSATMPEKQPGEITRIDWDFGDGSVVTDGSTSIAHMYTKNAMGGDTVRTVAVRVTAHDNDGNVGTATRLVVVTDLWPHVVPGGTYFARPDQPVALAGTATDDGDIVRYEWDFDGDGMYEWNSTADGRATHSYSSIGVFNAVFRATDDDGNMTSGLAHVNTYLNVWSTGADMPTARSYLAAAVMGENIYALGGFDSQKMEIFNTATGLWSTGEDMPWDRWDFGAAVVDGNIYLVGGLSFGTEDNVYIYNEQYDIWSSGVYREPIPTPRYGLAAAAIDGRIYTVGGKNGDSALEIYDPQSDSWSKGPDMPTARYGLAAVVLEGKLYAVGGTTGYRDLRTLEVYDLTTGTWSAGPDMPTARSRLAAGVVDGKLYVVGGYGGPKAVEVFDPATNRWTVCPDMPTARSGFAAAAYDHKLYVFGGDGPLRTLEILSW